MAGPLWQPSPDRIERSNIARFMDDLRKHNDKSVSDFDSLHAFSLRSPEDFWSAVWTFCRVKGDIGEPPYIACADKMPGATFFPNARLNFAENLIAKDGGDEAIIFRGEDKVRRTLSWPELGAEVSQFQQLFLARGLTSGDRVAAMMPNMPEAVTVMLGAASLGAIWSSCSPDFGVKSVLDRFGQIEPKILVACDGYYYNGKTVRIADKLSEIVQALPSLQAVIIVPYLGEASDVAAAVEKAAPLGEALGEYAPKPPQFERLPFSHPLYILYSSGTTGVPKCIVHSAGGTLLQHLKEHQLHCDLKSGDKLFYFTTCGWMMWNWLVSGLASEATLLLYDGSPFAPSGDALFDYAQDERMTIFGTSAKFIDAVKKAGLRPRETHDLSSVRLITSTGSPLAPESFDFVYEHIKSDVQLVSISGGTDIVSCFVLGNPLQPVWKGEIQGPGLGMAVDIFDESGEPLKSGKGELVCKTPFPSMPIGFWNDPDGQKYHDAYFNRFDNIWHHGDFAEWTEHGGIIIHGRSDATLNPGGVRIGTAEIYRQVEQLDEVQEAIVIGQNWDNDVRVVLFVTLQGSHVLDDDLRDKIKQRIREGASPRHVPAKILDVPDIPRTKSGKITELAVRDAVHGREINNREALANPGALDYFRNRSELAS